MVGTCRALIKLERLMVWNVIRDRSPGYILVVCGADSVAVRVTRTWLEASMEPAPRDAVLVQQIAHVGPDHLDIGSGCRRRSG